MTTYTVKSGDSLSKIALSVYGTYNNIGSWNPVTAIAQANNIANVNLISVGQVLSIPDKPGTVVSSTPAAVQTSSAATPIATTQAQAQPPATNNNSASGSGSNVLKYVLISIIIGTAGFIGYKEYQKHKAKKKGA